MTVYTQYIPGKCIRTGCEWRLQFRVKSGAGDFGPNARFLSNIRENDANGKLLATLKTEYGTVMRVDDRTILLALPDKLSRDWTCDKVALDIVRTDLSQVYHLGFTLHIPVVRSVTRL